LNALEGAYSLNLDAGVLIVEAFGLGLLLFNCDFLEGDDQLLRKWRRSRGYSYALEVRVSGAVREVAADFLRMHAEHGILRQEQV
jgi:hypothetical protein